MKRGKLDIWATDCAVLVLALLFGALSYIVRKRRGTIAFYPSFDPHGYAGNLPSLFERLSAAPPPGMRPVWLTRSEALARDLAARGLSAKRVRGRPLWTLLRAEWIVLDSTEPRIGFGRHRLVQVWHGSGFKRIGLEKEGRTPMRRAALRSHFHRYRLIVAASRRDAVRKAECFDNPNAAILGSPRNDSLVGGSAAAGLRERLSIGEGVRVVAYCPTYREDGRAKPFGTQEWRRLDSRLAQTNAMMLVKRHPRDRALDVPAGLTHVRDVTDAVADVQALLAASDMLISDYSSIVTDFAILGRPMIFFTYDLDHFREEGRGLYDDLVASLPGPFAMDADALIELVGDTDWAGEPAYRTAIAEFRDRYHRFTDAGATQRVADAIRDLIERQAR